MTDDASHAGRFATADVLAAAAISLARRAGGCVIGATLIVIVGATIDRG